MNGTRFGFAPASRISNVQATSNEPARRVSADFGNALPTVDAGGALLNVGDLRFGLLRDADTRQGEIVRADGVAVLGPHTVPRAGLVPKHGGRRRLYVSPSRRHQ